MKKIPQPPFKNKAQTIAFLKKLSNKNNCLRVIAWLNYFDLIDLKSLSQSIYFLYDNYNDTILKCISDIQNPVNSLPRKDERYLINVDTQRSQFWFKKLIEEAGLDPCQAPTNMVNIQRILVALRLTDDFYEYVQGFDRYVCITMILSLEFSSQIDESIDFAESISFYLCQKILRIVDLGKYSKDVKLASKHFSAIDKRVMATHPEEYEYLLSMNTTSIYYAMKWELLSFADVYNYNDLLLLWDQIILHKSDYMDFILELCVAHIETIKFDDPSSAIETIQDKSDWDVIKIIKITNENIKKRLIRKVMFYSLFVIIFILIIIKYLK